MASCGPAPRVEVSPRTSSPPQTASSSEPPAARATESQPSASAAPPSAPSSQPSAASEASQAWANRLRTFYLALSRDPAHCAAPFRALFAARLERYISLRSVTREAAVAAAESFLSARTGVSYSIPAGSLPRVESVEEGGRSSQRVNVELDARFSVAAPAAWREIVPRLADSEVTTEQRLKVELRATPEGDVFYYDEAPGSAPRNLRVARATHGYALPFAPGCWPDPGDDELSRVPLAPGRVLEPTGRTVGVYDCGPPTTITEVRAGKQKLWVLTALYELVPNPNGGSSLGGTDFVEWAAP